MTTRHYTVFVEGQTEDPQPLGLALTKNCAGQLIVFDGKTDGARVGAIAAAASRCFKKVQVFRGVHLGKLIYEHPHRENKKTKKGN